MKKKFTLLSISVYFTLLLFSCGKTIDETHPEFLGFWKSKTENGTHSFRFNEDGTGKYGFVGDSKMDNKEGKFRIKNDQLSVGLHRFEINAYPFEGEGYTKMIVEKIEYFKVGD